MKQKIILTLGHSLKDGKSGTIGIKGIERAIARGESPRITCITGMNLDADSLEDFFCVFTGSQAQNSQTALAFFRGYEMVPKPMPTVFGFGDDQMIAEIATEEFKAAVASGLSLLTAIKTVHSIGQIKIWAEQCRTVLMEMFSALAEGQTAIAFFYRLPILLAAMVCGAPEAEEHIWADLKEMDGLIFATDEDGLPFVVGKISGQADANE